MSKTIFVTVGSTHFDSLISLVDSPAFASAALSLGYSRIVAQVGAYPSPVRNLSRSFAYAPPDELARCLSAADLVIGHAGAGTIIEALQLGKPLIVVANESLMANHQTELARECCRRGALQMATTATLIDALARASAGRRIAFDGAPAAARIAAHFGFDTKAI